MRCTIAAASVFLMMTTLDAGASDPFGILETADQIAARIQADFACKGKACLEKSVVLGTDSVPERHRALTGARYRHGESKRSTAGILGTFVGACEWNDAVCNGVYIEQDPTHDKRSVRYSGPHGSRALSLGGFRDTEHQVNFLTRMALIAERLGLETNIGLGLVTSKDDVTGFSYQMTFVGVNGGGTQGNAKCSQSCNCKKTKNKKCSCKKSCASTGNSKVWGYGYRTPQQILLQSKIRTGIVPAVFAQYFLGYPPQEVLQLARGETGIIMPVQARTTFYAPGAASRVEGPFETSMPNVEGIVNAKGIPIPRTLDDVRLGTSAYVSVASDPTNYGAFLYLGAVTYKSPLDEKTYTGDETLASTDEKVVYAEALKHVFGYVNDTGSAFKGRPDKFDVAVGNFSGWKGKKGEEFVDGQGYGKNVVHNWLFVRSLPVSKL